MCFRFCNVCVFNIHNIYLYKVKMYLCKPKSMAEVILLIQDSEVQFSNKKVLKALESSNQFLSLHL